jgi:two-component system phosphate regulon sensor histidine kinase PhoR
LIQIKITNLNKEVSIKVHDNGIGMEREEIKHIFKKFYRAPTGNIHNVKGFGIGLSYVDQIVKMHSGSIEVSSKKNKGTTFEIILPKKTKLKWLRQIFYSLKTTKTWDL